MITSVPTVIGILLRASRLVKRRSRKICVAIKITLSAKFIKVGEYNNGKKENCSRQLEDEYAVSYTHLDVYKRQGG